jgi:hypothetical protein
MAIDKTKYRTGPANIYLGCTVPTGSNMIQLSSGVPTSGVHVGSTEGKATITVKQNLVDIIIEQASAPVDGLIDKEDISCSFMVKEVTFDLMKKYMLNPTYTASVTDGGAMGNVAQMTFGGKADIVTPVSLVLVWERRDSRGKYGAFQIYNAVPPDGMLWDLTRVKEVTQQITFKGYADPTRASGDQIARLYEQL